MLVGDINLTRVQNQWTQRDVNKFHKLPVHFAHTQATYLKQWQLWPKLLKKRKWRQNEGNLLQGIRKEPSAILQAQVLPQPITMQSRRDVIEINESHEFSQVYKHDFDSLLIHWLPNFTDWLHNHVSFHRDDMNEKIQIYNDLFHRAFVFHASPRIWVCGRAGGELIDAPHFRDQNFVWSKDSNFLQDAISQVGSPLTLQQLRKLGGMMYSDIGATPYSGSILPDGTDGKALAMKYCLVTSAEVWDAFGDDSFVLNHKNDSLNVVTGPFQGSLFGRWTSMFERHEMRIGQDGVLIPPETVEANPDSFEYGTSVPNPDYTNADFGVAFAVGASAYEALEVGPPPADWTQMSMKRFANLNWSGKVDITQNLLVPTGGAIPDTNKRGDYIQLIASLVMGSLPIRRRNIVPIIYARRRAGSVNYI